MNGQGKKRIGVFVCHCGVNIAGVVDVERVAREMADYSDVALSTTYMYMCSEPGQSRILDMAKEHDLNAIVISACSPTLHEITFQKAAELAGINPYQVEIANIREQCSWVHNADKEQATLKALEIVKTAVEKIRLNQSLEPIKFSVDKKILVIGGGISGMQAALDVANAGVDTILVERENTVGGQMAQLSKTFLTLDRSQEILMKNMMDVHRHPKIELMTYSEVQEVSGYVGNFTVGINQKASFVDNTKCDGCGKCLDVCPVSIPYQDQKVSWKKHAVSLPDLNVIPRHAVIDSTICTHQTDGCHACSDICPKDAIDFSQQPVQTERQVGAMIVATGFDTYPKKEITEYSADKYEDVVDSLQFERLLAEWEEGRGQLRRPSDGKPVERVVFIQCVRSRDPECGVPYCSGVCCKYTAKQAVHFKKAVPNGQAMVFYIDVRTGGKQNDEFYQDAIAESQVLYLKGKVTGVEKEEDVLIVKGTDELTNSELDVACDLVVLVTPMVPNTGARDLAQLLNIAVDENGFFSEIHPKLRPVESPTAGVYLAGSARGPMDIPESITFASGAASKVMALFSQDEISHEPIIAWVDEDLCSGCGICIDACPYGARVMDEKNRVAKVIGVLCQGCGACVAACPNSACQQHNFSFDQYLNMIDAII